MPNSYLSASQFNSNDLRELIFSVYFLPEIFINKFGADPENIILKDVIFPQISLSNRYIFVGTYRFHLEISKFLQSLIDLIFGFKQSLEEAILSKNDFLLNCSIDQLIQHQNNYI
jgi:hypothetical protein